MENTQIIDELSKKFGVTAEYLVEEMARYALAMNISGIVIGIILTVGSLIVIKVMFKKLKCGDWFDGDINVLACAVSGIIGGLIGIVLIIACLMDCVGWIVSPTAGAIHYICR